MRAQPRQLLRTIPGIELVEPKEWELCCGSAGIYNLTRPEAAAELGERKADNLLATGAEAIVAANPGCTLQIAAHLRRKGDDAAAAAPDAAARAVDRGRAKAQLKTAYRRLGMLRQCTLTRRPVRLAGSRSSITASASREWGVGSGYPNAGN